MVSERAGSLRLDFEHHLIPMRPIGVVRSPFRERFGTPRQPGIAQAAEATIELDSKVPVESLEGLDGFSHIWILFSFHKDEPLILRRSQGADPALGSLNEAGARSVFEVAAGALRKLKAKVHPPRLNGRSIGVFATRSPHRPSPIGLSCVQLVSISGRTITIQSHDLVDGTIVLDIKPYLRDADCIPEAKSGWVDDLASTSGSSRQPPIRVTWSQTSDFSQLSEVEKKTIESILCEDPRPVCYRGDADQPAPYTNRYGFFHGNWNIVYTSDANSNEIVFRVELIERVR